MKSISFTNQQSQKGQPIHSRLMAFKSYFLSKNFEVESLTDKKSYVKDNYIFYSMPPFRNFNIFFKYKNKIILDIRDGWSIAQATGYGRSVRKKPLKALITRFFERFMINRSFLTITCTPGLASYLEKISSKPIILIPNGLSDNRIELIENLKLKNKAHKKNQNELVFVCAGKFSEYGIDKVKKLLSTIYQRYINKQLTIKLIGSDKVNNNWVSEYFKNETKGRGTAEILPRMNEEDLFTLMLNADYGLTIIRDPAYDLGTKIYDYIALDLPVINYFDEPNNFTDYFDACLDLPFNRNKKVPEIRRSVLIEKALMNVQF